MKWIHGARGRVLSQMQREQRDKRTDVKEDIIKEVREKPVYKALTWLRQPAEGSPKPKIKGSRKDVVPELDSLHTAIGKLGGIKKEELISFWGMDRATKFQTFSAVARENGGMSIDEMAELLAQKELAYLLVDENGKWDLREFEGKFFDEISGTEHYSAKNDRYQASESYEDEYIAQAMQEAGAAIKLSDLPHAKISLESLERLYSGEEKIYKDLPTGRWGIIGEEGLDVDVVATMFGYSSGDQMIREMVDAKPMKEEIDIQTDQRMQELYSELHTPEQIEKAATLAIRNEARAKLVHAELSALTKGVGDKNILARQARELAEKKIAEMTIDEINPEKYIAAERRANRMAEVALGKGKRNEAIELKRSAVLHYHFAKVAAKALEEVERGVKYTNRLDSKAARKAIPSEYSDQIDSLLEPFDMRKSVTKADRAKRMGLAIWLERQREMGFEPAIDERLLEESLLEHYKDMSLEEFRSLIDSVKSIEHLGRTAGTLLLSAEREELNSVVGQLVSGMSEHRPDDLKQPRETRLPFEVTKTSVKGWFAGHKKFGHIVRWFDNFKDGGVGSMKLLRPLKERTDWEAREKRKATEKLAEIFSIFTLAEKTRLYKKKYIEGIDESLSRSAMIAVALNWGNATNRQRLMGGEQWDHVQVQSILDELTEKEWDFVQSIWDYNETYWEAVSAKEKRVTGVAPEKVEHLPVHTKFGTYPGGYHAIKFSPERSQEAFKHLVESAEKNTKMGAFGRGMTKRDHTKQRVEGEVNIAMRLDLDTIFEHTTEVIHDLAFHEYLIDAGRIMNHEDFRGTVTDKYGEEIYAQLIETIRDVAQGEIPATGMMNRFFGHIRKGSTVSSLGMNLGTALLQPIGLTQSMVRIGPTWVMRGMYRWLRGPEGMQNTMDFILERSHFMGDRANNINREVSEIRNKIKRSSVMGEITGTMGDSYFTLIAKAQLIADVPTWLGMYEKIMEKGVENPETGVFEEVDESVAIYLADQAVEQSQGSGDMMHRSHVQKGSEAYKMFTNFYSYFNVLYNLTADSVHRTNFKSPAAIGQLAVDMVLLYWLPAAMAFTLREAWIRGECDHGRDFQCMLEETTKETAMYVLGTMVGIRELSGSVGDSYGYRGPAGARFFGATSRLIKQIKQGESDEALWDAAFEVAGILFHFPGVQAERVFRAILNEDPSRLFGEPKGDK